jgi:hypothetical protein
MRRSLFVLMLGLAAGLAAHTAWLHLRRPAQIQGLDTDLAWMKAQLELSADQFTRIQEVHRQSSPRLVELARQVATMDEEFAAFERGRETSGEVDFLEFARFVQQRRAVEQACDDSARHLIAQSAEIMTPEQRHRYLALVSPALDPAPPGAHD